MKTVLIFLLIMFFVTNNNGYKILQVSLLSSRSHHNLNLGYTETLAKAGHEVTMISPFHKKDAPYRVIGVPEIFEFTDKSKTFGFSMAKVPLWRVMPTMVDVLEKYAEPLFQNKDVQNLLQNETEKFDVVIYEYFSGDFLLGFGAKYNCPVIISSPIAVMDSIAKLVGNPYSIATVPDFDNNVISDMNLLDRMNNLFLHVLQEIIEVFTLSPPQKKLYEKYFPSESAVESFDEVKNRVSLVFVNTHPSIGIPRPFLPNIIEIGGYHITEDPKPLDQDLQRVMDSAEHGVIYFSLGTLAKGIHMETKMKNSILRSFSKLKQTILWKFEDDVPDKPENIIIRKWMPQNSILKHSNLKLFITHGGLLSCTESVHFGVPLVTIPVFGDQPHNARMVVKRGQGVMLEVDNITESSLNWAIDEVLGNSHYAERARQLKDLYYDRTMSPQQTLTYYTEHVIRTGGAKHLSPPRLPRYSLLLLDVYALLLLLSGVGIYLILFCLRKLWDKINSKTDIGKKKN